MKLSDPVFSKVGPGSTPLERVATGHGSAEDMALVQDQQAQHQEWLRSKAGRKWLRSQRRSEFGVRR